MSSTDTWIPSKNLIETSNLHVLMQERGFQSFEQAHQWSVRNPIDFWQRTLSTLNIKFRKPFITLLDLGLGVSQPRWLVGAEMNIAETCLEGHDDWPAIISQRFDGSIERLTRRELNALSNRVANSLMSIGLQKGDAVAIIMTMTLESVACYLGILKAGGTVLSIPDSLPAEEIEPRLRIGKAKAVFTQDRIVRGDKSLPMYEKVCSAKAPRTIVMSFTGSSKATLRDGDLLWAAFLGNNEAFDTVGCAPHDPINILFSSGTTGEPKAIPWDHTTPIKSASDALYHHDVRPRDVLCWPTNLGWMMGPWLVFASLINQATLALYEGTPIEPGFCKFVQDVKVNILGLVPSIVKGWRNTGCAANFDWQSLRAFSSSGEASNAEDYRWLMQLNQPKGVLKPIIEYCGGTETGGGYIANNILTPQTPGEFNGKVMGIDLVILNELGKPCQADEAGEVFIIPPSIGLSTRLLNADNEKVYFQGCPTWEGKTLRRHGDRIIVLGPHRYQADGRADNTMNLGGIKVGSAEIERVVSSVPGVLETAAIGIPPKEGGPDRLVIYAVMKASRETETDSLKANMQKAIKQHLNPLFHLHDVCLIEALPRTPSNKVMHRQLRTHYRGRET